MDAPIPPVAPSPATTQRSRRPGNWLTALVVFFLGMILLIILLAYSNQNVLWLKPGEPFAAAQTGPLFIIKDKIKSWTLPVWQRFFPPQGIVELSMNFLFVSAAAGEQISPASPPSTSQDGMRGWILSASQFAEFNKRIQTNSGVASFSAPRIQTIGGGQAQIQTGTRMIGRVSPNQASPGTQVRVIMALLPKVVSGSVKVRMAAACTTFFDSVVETNFIGCQVTIPNGGAFVMDSGKTKGLSGTNYWLVISPTLLNPDGTPLKPRLTKNGQ